MTPTADRDAITPATTRRNLLLTGTLGAAATAFLAACGTKTPDTAGQSGVDPAPTVVPPTVPLEDASEVELTTDVQNLRTAASLELVVADAYTTYGPKITDAEISAQAARIAGEHTAFAATFNEGVVDRAAAANAVLTEENQLPDDVVVTEPNEWVQTNVVDPVANQLTSDTAILSLMGKLESMLAASYTQVVSDATTTEWRAQWASIAGGAARRAALLSNGGEGQVPTQALYPSTDAVSNNAKLVTEAAAE